VFDLTIASDIEQCLQEFIIVVVIIKGQRYILADSITATTASIIISHRSNGEG